MENQGDNGNNGGRGNGSQGRREEGSAFVVRADDTMTEKQKKNKRMEKPDKQHPTSSTTPEGKPKRKRVGLSKQLWIDQNMDVKRLRKCKSITEDIEMKLSDTHWAMLYEINGEARIELRRESNNSSDERKLYLTLSRFMMLDMIYDKANEELKKLVRSKIPKQELMYDVHIGGRVFVTIRAPYKNVDIRYRYLDDTVADAKPVFTRFGVNLNVSEWIALKCFIKEVNQCIVGIDKLNPCIFSHSTTEAVEACAECAFKPQMLPHNTTEICNWLPEDLSDSDSELLTLGN